MCGKCDGHFMCEAADLVERFKEKREWIPMRGETTDVRRDARKNMVTTQ